MIILQAIQFCLVKLSIHENNREGIDRSLCFQSNKLIVGHKWTKRDRIIKALYFDLANGGSVYAGYVSKLHKWYMHYPSDTNQDLSNDYELCSNQVEGLKGAKNDLLYDSFNKLKQDYQFTAKYNFQ